VRTVIRPISPAELRKGLAADVLVTEERSGV
jgi:hypothetical protein